MGQACRTPSEKTSQNSCSSTPVATSPLAKASERRSAKALNLTLPVVPHVIPVPRAGDTEKEPSSASGHVDTDHERAQANPASNDHAQDRSSTPVWSSADDRTKSGWQTECATSESA